MSDLAAYLADSAVGVAAGTGALLVLSRVDRFAASPALAWRFRLCLWVLAALMFVRVIYWGAGGWLSATLTLALAGLLPLCAMLLAEGLLRRHAPPALKLFVTGGAVAMVLLAPLPAGFLTPLRIGALLALQVVGLLWVAWMVVARDRASLSQAENQSIDRMALSLLLILPLLATDFLRDDLGDIPVRMGGIGVLGLAWLSVNMNRAGLTARAILKGVAAALAVTGAAVLIVTAIAGLDLRGAVQVGAVMLSAVLLLAIWQAAMAFVIEDRQARILSAIAHARDPARLVQAGSGAPDALVLGEAELADVDSVALARHFAAAPVYWSGDPVTGPLSEQLGWLCTRFEATHLVCLSRDPLRIVALSNPGLTRTEAAHDTLLALQRMAALMQERPA
ncbi:hypothetical protein [Mesobacterium pallidum]|uniref:hypothetical protein n=1 Tax=Mesobacterium pallidum TaxID=2872037 RepID=UPI001EE22E96|nr:hypothetical protein [Mesobacterium pallidum]